MPRLRGFRYPREIIANAVWAYYRLALSTADVGDLLAARSVIVSRERVRLWVNRFGCNFADCIRRDRPRPAHRAHKALNNTIEVSHRPTRKQEKIFGWLKSHRKAQRFLSAHDQIKLIFRPRRYQVTAITYRHARCDAFSLWADNTAEFAA